MSSNESESAPSTPSSPCSFSIFSHESRSTDTSSNSDDELDDELNNRPTTLPTQPSLETSQEYFLLEQLAFAHIHLRQLRRLLGLDANILLEQSAAKATYVAIKKGRIHLPLAVDIDEIGKLVFVGRQHRFNDEKVCSIIDILQGKVRLLEIMGNMLRHCLVYKDAQSLPTKLQCAIGMIYHCLILTLYNQKVVEGEKPKEVRALGLLGLFLQEGPENSDTI